MLRWRAPNYASSLQLPGPGYFRCPARYTAITSLVPVLLAGHGLDRPISDRRFRTSLILAALFALASLAWAVVWTTRPAFRSGLADAALAARVGLTALIWSLELFAPGLWRRERLGAWGLILLTTLEAGTLYHVGTTQWGWSVRLPGSSPVLTFLGRESGAGRVGGALDNRPVRGGFTTVTPYVGSCSRLTPCSEPRKVLETHLTPPSSPGSSGSA